MAARRIDREEWARQVARLISKEAGGNKSRFAALVGVTYKTVNRWLNSEVDVSEEKVREVARALHISAMDLLVRVGYYAERDLAQPTPPEPAGDPAIKAIMDADRPEHIKRRMLQRLAELRMAQRDREVEEVQWWLDQSNGA